MKASIAAVAAAFLFSGLPAASAQQATPSPQATTAASPATTPSATVPPKQNVTPKHPPKANAKRSYKKIRAGSLTFAQAKYGITHPLQEAAKLRSMKRIKFENLRIYRISPALLKSLRASASEVAYDPYSLSDVLAQSSNPLLAILANVNVTDALNNVLNGNNVAVTLSNVLNANNVGIGQLVGLYIGGGGIITTIV